MKPLTIRLMIATFGCGLFTALTFVSIVMMIQAGAYTDAELVFTSFFAFLAIKEGFDIKRNYSELKEDYGL